ncbi:peroxiredoxin [Bacillus ectoiniformans]|uniref:peroxiredoxin family protein n=1 Tax=Bacillus ectoiniformans TaxID=1494429 RepID=UPI00195C4913|nr:TlpA disulfide reductase family protein [Bacillus ectoiniformans]MBM7648781.1 peroxiredoxin [Bacillus ectoiniformans]
MGKKWFGILLVALLIGIAAVNIINDRKEQSEIENPGQIATENQVDSSVESGLGAGQAAPDFTLNSLDGKERSLSDYQGKKVILNFWATWCPPCKAEMPHMQKFYEKEAKDRNVEILAVNLTSSDKGTDAIKEFAKQYELTFPIPLDEEGAIGKQYEAYTIPTTYIINTDGTIHQKIIGPMDEEMMRNLVSEAK